MKKQKGVALIVVLLVSLIVTAILLGIVAIVLDKFGLVQSADSTNTAASIARSGIEKTWYYHHVAPLGAASGICNIPANCPTDASDPAGNFSNHCNNFTATGADCGAATCTNCEIFFESNDDGNQNTVSAAVHCVPPIVDVVSTGRLPDGTTRSIESNNREGFFSGEASGDASSQMILKPCPDAVPLPI